ncbi:TonB-dependent siderophore receptor [Achromobacter seleniivolatilans]|uniref:TonB-dependent siderophore receptor n=1 Tax=Achromobacter seleniivolatilans TaxID=3047478 RepID=A0ABY9M5W6_9BURK|nr:TonB-dependent siderophore receptor [Achromobacter sp. R39]WMD22402.1 TonB-dependent siderophore receptor [Achromobacter sp. R39]
MKTEVLRNARVSRAPLAVGALSISLALALGIAPPQANAQNTAVQVAIPAQPLGKALLQLGRQTSLQIFYAQELVQGLSAPAVSGSLTPEQALQQLLSGTGIEYSRQDNNVTLSRPAATGATVLAPVTVDGIYGATTEGTGSYTVRETAAATGLKLSPRETPQSVSVVTRQEIEDLNLTTLGESFKNVTGIVTSTSDVDRTDIHSRGFFVDTYQYDGVPVSTKNDFFGTSNFDPVLYDRIEVVRGATGLMTGAGNPGASVNLVRKRASSKVFTGALGAGIGSWDHHRATVDLSTPLNAEGSVRGRVSGMMEERDSYLDRYHTRNRAMLATVEADLTANTTLRIGYEHQAKRPTEVTWGGLPMLYSDGSAASWSRHFSIGADWTTWNTTSDTVYASLDHQFSNGWTLTANASRLDSKYNSKLLYLLGQPDRVTGEGLGAFANRSKQEFDQNSGSIQASGPFELFGRQHEAVIGLMGSNSHYRAGYYPVLSTGPIGNIFAWDGSYAEPTWGDFGSVPTEVTQQTAVYGAARFALSNSLKLIVGGRQNRWTRENGADSMKHNVFTPYAGLVYDFNEVYSGYVSYTDIFQPQSYRDASGGFLDPVVGKSYETGIKADYFEGKLTTSFSVFRIKQDNVGERDGENFVPGTSEFAYRGTKGLTSEGFELQASGELTAGWQLSAGLSRALVRNPDGSRYTPYRPQNLAHLFTTYRVPGTSGKLTVGGGMQWRSAVYIDQTTSRGVKARREQGSVMVANLMANYRFTPNLSAQLNVSNLLDKKYFNLTGDGQGFYGSPTKTMLTVKYAF